MIGWRVGWPVDEPKIHDKILDLHRRKRALRARFKRGAPGQALDSRVEIIRRARIDDLS